MVFATCGGNAGDTLQVMEAALGERKVTVEGSFLFTRKISPG
jgi:hypothetical protein